MPALTLVDHAFEVAGGDPLRALTVAVEATRWKLLAEGKLDPEPDEVLPAEVWRARKARKLACTPGRRYAWFRFDRAA